MFVTSYISINHSIKQKVYVCRQAFVWILFLGTLSIYLFVLLVCMVLWLDVNVIVHCLRGIGFDSPLWRLVFFSGILSNILSRKSIFRSILSMLFPMLFSGDLFALSWPLVRLFNLSSLLHVLHGTILHYRAFACNSIITVQVIILIIINFTRLKHTCVCFGL